ncbi:putative hetero-Diels-Alderase [Paramyrothecium foliicola]|nr:putative hetero-Diels-Alderase [Paramyrothecium foliicola]
MHFYNLGLKALVSTAIYQLSAASPFIQSYKHTATPALAATVPGQQFENIAIRRNGDALLTSLSSSTLYLVPKDKPENHVEIATFPGITALFGIAELEKDVFYVSGAIINGPDVTPGTNVLWEIDLRKFGAKSNSYNIRRVRTRKVADLPTAGILNGMCRLTHNDQDNLLMSDSFLGAITKINVKNGQYKTTIQDPSMAPVPQVFNIGVNGIRTHENYLYYLSTGRQIFARVPIGLKTASITGPVEVLLEDIFADDFVLSRDGRRAWLATNIHSTVVEVDIVAGASRSLSNSTLLSSATSVALGRTRSDKNSLYVSASSNGENGLIGNVVQLDLS